MYASGEDSYYPTAMVFRMFLVFLGSHGLDSSWHILTWNSALKNEKRKLGLHSVELDQQRYAKVIGKSTVSRHHTWTLQYRSVGSYTTGYAERGWPSLIPTARTQRATRSLVPQLHQVCGCRWRGMRRLTGCILSELGLFGCPDFFSDDSSICSWVPAVAVSPEHAAACRACARCSLCIGWQYRRLSHMLSLIADIAVNASHKPGAAAYCVTRFSKKKYYQNGWKHLYHPDLRVLLNKVQVIRVIQHTESMKIVRRSTRHPNNQKLSCSDFAKQNPRPASHGLHTQPSYSMLAVLSKWLKRVYRPAGSRVSVQKKRPY
jgi:hypothetical protein